jgi:hypothetical protein
MNTVLLVRCFHGGGAFLLLGNTFGQESIVFLLLLLLADQSSAVERTEMAAALETDGSNETLDLGANWLR